MSKKREPLDLTDAELYQLSLALESRLYDRHAFFSKKSARILNNLIKKVVDNGMTRKNPQDMLHPIMDFEND